MHRAPGEIARAKQKPKEAFRGQPDPAMAKAQAREMLKNLGKEA